MKRHTVALGLLALGAAVVGPRLAGARDRSPAPASTGSALESSASLGDPLEAADAEEVVVRPDLGRWLLQPLSREPEDEQYDQFAVARDFEVKVSYRASADSSEIGLLRRGRMVRARLRGWGAGCSGRWAQLAGGGYVCTGAAVEVFDEPPGPGTEPLPALGDVLPYQYARVTTSAAPRFDRIPTPQEERDVAEGHESSGLSVESMVGDVFVAVAELHEDEGRRFYRTVEGKYVRADDLRILGTPPMHGELVGDTELSMAFVFGGDAPLFQLTEDGVRRLGLAPKHARFEVSEVFEHEGHAYAASSDGIAVLRENVRLVESIERPDFIDEDRWIHIDLSEQFLVAYEGERPVLATVVSTGKEGYFTPTGRYYVRHKYVSTTMSGGEDIGEPYEVEEVPWTMYYYGGYAIHGAYWHDDFGNPRSHGCINLAPADARWLYRWSTPNVPQGWQGVRGKGTRVYITS